MNHGLMQVIEDQWRKQLHEEQEQEEADRRNEEATRVEGIVKEGRRSRQRKETDGRGMEEAKGEMDGRNSRQEVTADGRVEGAKGREEGRRSREDMGADARGVETDRVEGQRSRRGVAANDDRVEDTELRADDRSRSRQGVLVDD